MSLICALPYYSMPFANPFRHKMWLQLLEAVLSKMDFSITIDNRTIASRQSKASKCGDLFVCSRKFKITWISNHMNILTDPRNSIVDNLAEYSTHCVPFVGHCTKENARNDKLRLLVLHFSIYFGFNSSNTRTQLHFLFTHQTTNK